MGIGLGMFFGLPLAGLLLFVAYFAAWWYSGIFYGGDGEYMRGVDHAAWQVRFAPIDVSRRGRYTFRFSHLAPEVGYCAGFRVDGASPPDATVALSMRDGRGNVVFAHEQPVSDRCAASFMPRWSDRYTLIVDVVGPDPAAAGVRVRPVLSGYWSGP